MARNENRLRRVVSDHRFENLADKDVPARLTKMIGTLAEAISEDREVKEPPGAGPITATSLPGAIYLTWSDVPRDIVPSIDGVRIWRAKASEDANEQFFSNNKKSVLISLIRTTGFIDIPGDTASRIYWVQHISRDGREGRASGGVTKAAT